MKHPVQYIFFITDNALESNLTDIKQHLNHLQSLQKGIKNYFNKKLLMVKVTELELNRSLSALNERKTAENINQKLKTFLTLQEGKRNIVNY